LDLGHTAIKRGLATLSDGGLRELRVLPSRPAPHPDQVVAEVVEAITDTVGDGGSRLDPNVVVSVASYLDGAEWPLDSHSLYAPLGALQPAELDAVLHERSGRPLHVRFVHDGTAAARALPATVPTAVIVLGTALGVGFAPHLDRVVPLAAEFRVGPDQPGGE
jgi:hypothetical protein